MPVALKYQRTEYAKKIRKDYEPGKIKERRCNMREYTLRTDGLCNTITTVQKDNYIAVENKEYLDICINDKGKVNKKPQITHGYAPTLVSEFHGNLPKVVEVRCAAMRGRHNLEGKTEQQIEVRDDELSNTITTVQKDGLVIENFSETANELIFVGGIESNKWLDNGKNLSRNYKQGYRVYDSDGIACALTAQGTGGLGGYSGLYLVREKRS